MKSLSEALRGASQKQNMNFVDENKIYYKDIDELYPNPHNEKFYNRITKENIVMENYILYQATGEEKQLNNYLKKV